MVTTKGDTVRGELRTTAYGNIDRVQVIVDNKKMFFTAMQVLAVHESGSVYKPAQYQNTVQLMKVLKSGYLSLYAFRVGNQTSLDGRLLIKLDGTSIEVPNLTFKKSLATFLEDCPTISEKVKDGELAKKDLDLIIDQYNSCLDVKTQNRRLEASGIVEKTENEKTIALESLRKKVEAIEFKSKKDASDLITDIQAKLSKNEIIPNYLSEGLKSYLTDQPSLQEDLEKLLELLKK